MALNHDAVGVTSEPFTTKWTTKDTMLYALGVGCGTDDLHFATENSRGFDLQALPTMPVVLARTDILTKFGEVDWSKLVHAQQSVVIHKPVPPKGMATNVARISGIYDKGKAAIVATETDGTDAETGERLWTTRMSLFIRGEGGWGGESGPSSRIAFPESKPDDSLSLQTAENQALIYRLSGDRNPLHSDPSFARKAGFERPILHGLCTYGVAGRALLAMLAEGDPSRMKAISARFASPVLPGDLLTTEVWKHDEKTALFRVLAGETVVLSDGLCELT
jgi:acyl dehydratase